MNELLAFYAIVGGMVYLAAGVFATYTIFPDLI